MQIFLSQTKITTITATVIFWKNSTIQKQTAYLTQSSWWAMTFDVDGFLRRDLSLHWLHWERGPRADHVGRESGRDQGLIRQRDGLGDAGQDRDHTPVQLGRGYMDHWTLADTWYVDRL